MAKDAPADFYVSLEGKDDWSGTLPQPNAAGTDGPFRTVRRAQQAVRAVRAGVAEPQATTVLLRGGRYELSRALVFTAEDSGTATAPITYAAYPGECPVFSGGQRIVGWREGKDGVWMTQVPTVKKGQWYFQQLFVNGERRQRARLPKQGYFLTEGPLPELADYKKMPADAKACTAFVYQPGDLQHWQNLQDVVIQLFHSWTSSVHFVAELDEEKRQVHFANRCGWPVGYWEKQQRYFVENVREALTDPGEWYLDRKSGTLYYKPLPGEKMAEAEVMAPRLQQLLWLKGVPTKGELVQYLTLRGLSFQHAEWSDRGRGMLDGQAAIFLDAAVMWRGARHCRLEQCEVAHAGEYALWLEEACTENVIEQCHLHDLGGGGVKVGQTDLPNARKRYAKVPRQNDRPSATSYNTLDNNYIHAGGRIFPAAVGIIILRSSSNCVTHNDICDLFYTGVSVGWSWGYWPTTANDNLIEWNHIHHLGQGVLSDMGAVYTLNPSPGTVVRYNLIHDIDADMYGGWGLYTDEGSSQIVMENNICYNTKHGGFHQHYGRENIIRNNILACARERQAMRTRPEEHCSIIFERNLLYCINDEPLGGNWTGGGYVIDHNLYWNAKSKRIKFAGQTFAQWQKQGNDANSIIADPLFVDPEHGDFRLQAKSPALKIGFVPFDLSAAGLYGDKKWTALPAKYS